MPRKKALQKTSEQKALIRTTTPKVEYNKDAHPLIVRALSASGVSLRKISAEIGISLTTLQNWFKRHPEFRQAYELGLQDDVSIIESSFIRLCLPHTLCEREIHYDKDGEIIKTVVKEKQVDPNAQAVYRFLMAKARDKWSVNPDDCINVPNITVILDKKDANL